jgi:Phosphoesterase family
MAVIWAVLLTATAGLAVASAPSATSTYAVGFHESGLSGQTWSVTLGGARESTSGQGGWIAFQEPNGSYSYTVSAPAGFVASPSSGTVSISGHNPPYVAVSFSSSARYTVGFRETGLSGQAWSVSIGGMTASTNGQGGWIVVSEPNGTYAYTVASPAGYTASPTSGSVVVKGSNPPYVPISFTASGTLPTSIQHVVVVVLENVDLPTIRKYSPYLDYLANTYGQATEFYGACHGSLPNYAAMTSGRYYVCGGAIPLESAENLPDVLQAKTLSWGGYFESMPTPCDRQWSGDLYDPQHNPFLLSRDIVGNASRCDLHLLNSAAFNGSVANGTLPAFSYYVPNTHDDGEDSNLTVIAAWLKGFLAPMLNSSSPTVQQLMQHTAFFILFDEGLTYQGYSVGGIVNSYCQNSTGSALTVCGGHTYLAVVSPLSRGTTDTSDVTDYSVESTIEWLLGVGNDGGYDGSPYFPAMTALFSG